MESDRELADRTNAMDSPPDLQQVKDALSLLRVSSPQSVLADLVEEKIRTMENGGPTLHRHSHRPKVAQSLAERRPEDLRPHGRPGTRPRLPGPVFIRLPQREDRTAQLPPIA